MTKKAILVLTAALGLTMGAQANLGDGYTAAVERWGNPVDTKPAGSGTVLTYVSNGWRIEQFYNAAGSAVAVRYYKPIAKGKSHDYMTKAELDGLWSANVQEEGDGIHWQYLPKSNAKQQMWYSAECQTMVDIEVVSIEQKFVHCMIFATVPAGTDLIDAYLGRQVGNKTTGPSDPTKTSI